MLSHLRPALVLLLALAAITGLAYPLALTGLAALAFPREAAGSLVGRDGSIVGSALIGQAFTGERYFHGRPSATVAPDPADAARTVPASYNAANSAGSNLGPTSAALAARLADAVESLKKENPGQPVPIDLATASGSGLDPDVSPAAALFQAPRVARARGLPEVRVRDLVAAQARGRLLGVLGEPRVNVLALNLALDELARR